MPADLQARYVEMLLDHVRADPYPSTTMMDLLEQSLTDEQRAAYAQALIDKAAADRFPSLEVIRRIARLVGA